MAVLTQPHVRLEAELARVREAFDAELTSTVPFVKHLTERLRQYRGKLLRPTLLLLSAKASGTIREAHYVLGAVVEMVHMATLLHDDVLDESQLRRNQPTLHALEGNEAAVLFGDYLFSHAFHLCSSLGSQEASRLIASTAQQLCAGELRQVGERKNWNLTRGQYFEIIAGKTALLVAVSCHLGAKWAGATSETGRRLEEYGLHCGLAFQIVDDVLDLVGQETNLGKNTGRDIGMGKMTLPLILYLEQADASSRQRMIGLLEDGHRTVEQIRLTLQRSAAIEQALEMAREQVSQAKASLKETGANPAIEALGEMAEFILQRQG